MPAEIITGVRQSGFDYYLASSASFVQWVRDSKGNRVGDPKPDSNLEDKPEDKPEAKPEAKPDGLPVESSAIGLVVHPPTTLTQRLIYDCRKIQRTIELNRPQALSPGNLVANGYNIEAGDRDPANLAVISGVISANNQEYEAFDRLRTDTYVKIIDLVYPESSFSTWIELAKQDTPIDVETLTAFAVAQVESFLQGQPGSLLSA